MQTIKLDNYNIYIGHDIWDTLVEFLAQKSYPSIFVLCDENTYQHCLPKLNVVLKNIDFKTIIVKAGEQYKTIETCTYIWQQMMEQKAGRKSLTINLGGGVVGDMGGFCASTFKRGMDFIQIPTTLLSQVDASIGGKLGIDFMEVKNSIGIFNNPQAIFIDTAFYKTLPPREIRSGFAEVLKHALIADPSQWERLQQIEELSTVNWEHYLIPSLKIKRDIVAQDPFERGIRKALNFGHTIGHAVESYFLNTATPLLHGEAIAKGMIGESWLSMQYGDLSKDAYERIRAFILKIYGRVDIPSSAYDELIATMKQDKKNEDHRINFTFLKKEGKAVINQTLGTEEILQSL